MQDDTFQLIISQTEYDLLKQQKQIADSLNLKLQQSQQQNQKLVETVADQKLAIFKLQQQNKYLVNLFERFNQSVQQEENCLISVQMSQNYEILGKTMIQSQAPFEEVSPVDPALDKKYAAQIKMIQEIAKKQQSQEILISQLNDMNAQKNLAINHSKAEAIKQLLQSCGFKDKTINDLKKAIQDGQKVAQDAVTLKSDLNVLGQDCKKVKDDLFKATTLISHYLEKIKKLEAEKEKLIQEIKKSASEEKYQGQKSKGDRSYKIRLLIDEHIKELEDSLKMIGGLTKNEIKKMILDELSDISNYIPKAIASIK